MISKRSKLFLLFGVIAFLIELTHFGYITTGTAAVIIALGLGLAGIFRDWIKSQFFYPELDINFKVEPPDCHKTFMTYKDKHGKVTATHDCYYYRMKIENSGNYQAERIEGIIVKKYTKNRNEKFEQDTNFLSLILRWSNDGAVMRERIMPSLFRTCNLGYILSPEGTKIALEGLHLKEKSKVVMVLDSDIKPNTGSHIIFPGTHRLQVTVVAHNTKACSKIFEIDFKDFWSDEEDVMLGKAMSVTPAKSLT